MRCHAVLLCLAIAASAAAALADDLADSDKQFLQQAAKSGMAEIRLGDLATQRTRSEDIRALARDLVDKHSQNQQLLDLARRLDFRLAEHRPDEKEQTLFDRMRGLAGQDFDRIYLHEVVLAHERDVARFRKAADEARNPAVKAFAAQSLLQLEKHLQVAKDLEARQSPTEGTGSSTAKPRP
ncbi:MAG: DUF4142 domain-containing protein [Acidobacteria bacterium]|nr:DUF4142 domain-containing protein [Acidobacteriota bacterium]